MEPANIQTKQFRTVRLREGYDPEEVDEFLDRVAAAWTDTQNQLMDERRNLAAAQAKIETLSRVGGDTLAGMKAVVLPPPVAPITPSQIVPANDGPSMESVARLLSVAERTVDEMVQQAQQESDIIRLKSREEAEAYLRDTRMSAGKLIQSAESRVAAEEQRHAVLQDKVYQLTEEKKRHVVALRRMLEAEDE